MFCPYGGQTDLDNRMRSKHFFLHLKLQRAISHPGRQQGFERGLFENVFWSSVRKSSNMGSVKCNLGEGLPLVSQRKSLQAAVWQRPRGLSTELTAMRCTTRSPVRIQTSGKAGRGDFCISRKRAFRHSFSAGSALSNCKVKAFYKVKSSTVYNKHLIQYINKCCMVWYQRMCAH